MKQTIKTKNYNAVIQIPYEKLGSKPNWTKINTQQQQCNKHSKTVIVPQCHACCCTYQKQNKVSIQQLQQLQQAFQTDMTIKNNQIQQLHREIQAIRYELSDNKNQIQKKNTLLSNQQIKYLSIIKDKDEQINRIKKQLQLGRIQRQKIMKTKIAQYQNNYLQYQRTQQQRIRALQQQYQHRNKQQINKLQLTYRQQKQNIKQQLIQSKLSLQHKTQSSDKQITRLYKQIQDYKSQINKLRDILTQKQQKYSNACHTINQKNLQLYKHQLASQIASKQLQQQTKQNNKHKQTIYKLQQTINTQQKLLSSKQQQINTKNKQYEQLNKQCQDILLINKNLQDKCNLLSTQLNQNTKTYTLSINKIKQLQISIKNYQQLINKKQVPKVYQVKIEKVIHRQDYIITLEAQLQKYKRNNLQLIDKIKQLQLIINHRQKQISQGKNKILQLQQQILKLKAYIQQKQRSFAWIVQRQITRDIQINKGQINKTYKVFPSQPKVYYNFKQFRQNQIPVRTFAQNQNLILQNIQSSNILSDIGQSGQLRQAIMRQLNKDITQDQLRKVQITSISKQRQYYNQSGQ